MLDWRNEMWDIIVALIVGAAIPIITQRIQSKEKSKYFELERKEKFKMVAIERRLAAHQEAFKLWYDLRSVIHKPDDDQQKKDVLRLAQEFWHSNSLYLEKQTRLRFHEAYGIVSNYYLWLQIYREMERGKEKEEHKSFYMKCWDDFHKLFEIIQDEVELEPIKPLEDKTPEGEELIKNKSKKTNQKEKKNGP